MRDIGVVALLGFMIFCLSPETIGKAAGEVVTAYQDEHVKGCGK